LNDGKNKGENTEIKTQNIISSSLRDNINNRRGNQSQQGARQSFNLEQSIGVDSWANYPPLIIHTQKRRALGSIGLLTLK
jgi:hypothetical protein